MILTEFVLKIARQHNLPPHPFLLALPTSANIGSAATPIGNPQNLVIAVQSKISFGDFPIGILPAMFVGLVVVEDTQIKSQTEDFVLDSRRNSRQSAIVNQLQIS